MSSAAEALSLISAATGESMFDNMTAAVIPVAGPLSSVDAVVTEVLRTTKHDDLEALIHAEFLRKGWVHK